MKYQDIYLLGNDNGEDFRNGLGFYFEFYNKKHSHPALGYKGPAEVHGEKPKRKKVHEVSPRKPTFGEGDGSEKSCLVNALKDSTRGISLLR